MVNTSDLFFLQQRYPRVSAQRFGAALGVSSGLVLDVPEVPVPVPAEGSCVASWMALSGSGSGVSISIGSGWFWRFWGSWVVPLRGSAGSGVGSGLGSDISLPRPGCDPTQDT